MPHMPVSPECFCYMALFVYMNLKKLVCAVGLGDGGEAPAVQIVDVRRATYAWNYNATVFLITLIMTILDFVGFGTSLTSFDDAALLAGNAPFIVLQLFIIWVASRVIKTESEARMMQYQDLKTSHLRYIAHELRTPMNTAILGLTLLQTTAKARAAVNPTDDDWKDQEDLLGDVYTSTFDAVELLNDLLHTEGLTSGVHDLNRTTVAVIPFLASCFDPFYVEARAKGLGLSVAFDNEQRVVPSFRDEAASLFFPTRSTYRVTSLPISETDSVVVDERKIRQVSISNFLVHLCEIPLM